MVQSKMFSPKSYYLCVTNNEIVQNTQSKPKKFSSFTFKVIGCDVLTFVRALQLHTCAHQFRSPMDAALNLNHVKYVYTHSVIKAYK
jgi:hypothetical protein